MLFKHWKPLFKQHNQIAPYALLSNNFHKGDVDSNCVLHCLHLIIKINSIYIYMVWCFYLSLSLHIEKIAKYMHVTRSEYQFSSVSFQSKYILKKIDISKYIFFGGGGTVCVCVWGGSLYIINVYLFKTFRNFFFSHEFWKIAEVFITKFSI